MGKEMNYRKYSKTELLDVLERIDEVEYPERAVRALRTLFAQHSMSESELLSSYRDNGLLLDLLQLVLFPLLGESAVSKAELRAKMQRILALHRST